MVLGAELRAPEILLLTVEIAPDEASAGEADTELEIVPDAIYEMVGDDCTTGETEAEAETEAEQTLSSTLHRMVADSQYWRYMLELIHQKPLEQVGKVVVLYRKSSMPSGKH